MISISTVRPAVRPCSKRLDCLATTIVPGMRLPMLRISGTSSPARSGSAERMPMKICRPRATKKKSLMTRIVQASASSGLPGSTSQ